MGALVVPTTHQKNTRKKGTPKKTRKCRKLPKIQAKSRAILEPFWAPGASKKRSCMRKLSGSLFGAFLEHFWSSFFKFLMLSHVSFFRAYPPTPQPAGLRPRALSRILKALKNGRVSNPLLPKHQPCYDPTTTQQCYKPVTPVNSTGSPRQANRNLSREPGGPEGGCAVTPHGVLDTTLWAGKTCHLDIMAPCY